MRHIAIWHCYWYGPHETIVLVAETQELLEAKVREAIAEGWYPDEQGPLPEDFSELMGRYQELSDDTCYFGDYTYTVLDSTLCVPVGDEA
jgi:hypothetical protein